MSVDIKSSEEVSEIPTEEPHNIRFKIIMAHTVSFVRSIRLRNSHLRRGLFHVTDNVKYFQA